MAEYLSGGRIQGSSTANPVTTYNPPTTTTGNSYLDVSSHTGDPSGIFVTSDGTKIFMNSTSGTNNDSVVGFTLGTAWDLEGTVTQDQTMDMSIEAASPRAPYFSNDGKRFFIVQRYAGAGEPLGVPNNHIIQWDLDTAYTFSTAGALVMNTTGVSGVNKAHKAIGATLSSSAWVARFRLVHTASIGAEMAILNFTKDNTSNANDCYADSINVNLGSGTSDPGAISATVYQGGGNDASGTIQLANNTTYYVEIKQTATNAVSIAVFTNPDYSSNQVGSTQTITGNSRISNLGGNLDTVQSTVGTTNTSQRKCNIGIDDLIIWSGSSTFGSGTKVFDEKFPTSGHGWTLTGSGVTIKGYHSQTFDLSATVGNSAGLKFNPDGTKFYVSHYGLWKVWQFSCTSGTPFDIRGASFDTGKTFVPTDYSTEGFDFTFFNNGLNIFMAEFDKPGAASGGASDGFVMTTAYDISTAAATGTTFDTNAVSNNVMGVIASGAYLFQLDGNGQKIYRFNAAANTTSTDEKTTITNVPVGTRYEETDTRKIYRRKAGGEAQANNVFNATNYTWATAGNSGNTITTGDDGTGQGVSSGSLSSYRRGKTTITSGNTKTFVWKFTWSRNSGDQANNSIFTLANFDWADSTPSGDEKNIKFQTSNTNVGFWRVQTASASVTSTQNSDFLQAAGTTRYYTVTGDGTNWKAQSWSDSARTTDEETTGDLGFPSDWLTTDPINNITFGSFGTADSNFTVKDISVKWDSGTAETWVEKGTA